MKFFRILILLLIITLPETLWAQKTRRVSGEYVFYAPNNLTIDQAKQVALDRAKVQLIADEYGTYVGSTNITRVENSNGASDVQMMSLGESEVKGEWIETIGDPTYEIGYEDNMLFVKVKVSGTIREIVSAAAVDIQTKLLRNGIEDRYEGSEFRSGDLMYLSFRTPVDGYVTVYLYDGDDTVYCLLPYQNQTSGQIPVTGDRKYIFFSASEAYGISPNIVDEYTLTCSGDLELNRMYIIFSPNLFTKALTDGSSDLSLPKSLSLNDFQKWLSKCRRQDPNMTLNIKDLVIRK